MQATIICFEMLVFAIVHRKVFSWQDFVLEEKDVESKPITDVLTDQLADFKTIGETGGKLLTHQVGFRAGLWIVSGKHNADQGTFGSGQGEQPDERRRRAVGRHGADDLHLS